MRATTAGKGQAPPTGGPRKTGGDNVARLKLWLRANDGRCPVDLQWPDMMATPILQALRGGGSIELYEMDSGATLALAQIDHAAIAMLAARAPIVSPTRAAPGSGDPGDPGLGKPAEIETGGPDGPSEG